ncbi:Calmodulin-like protein 3 [Armadillidium vulgare]|nr:Calmodulin-like protein 3 [Armadillidium vulgare]
METYIPTDTSLWDLRNEERKPLSTGVQSYMLAHSNNTLHVHMLLERTNRKKMHLKALHSSIHK